MRPFSIIMSALAAMCMLACSGNDVKYSVSGCNAPDDTAVVYLVDN